jgi:hypothetical protein
MVATSASILHSLVASSRRCGEGISVANGSRVLVHTREVNGFRQCYVWEMRSTVPCSV